MTAQEAAQIALKVRVGKFATGGVLEKIGKRAEEGETSLLYSFPLSERTLLAWNYWVMTLSWIALHIWLGRLCTISLGDHLACGVILVG